MKKDIKMGLVYFAICFIATLSVVIISMLSNALLGTYFTYGELLAFSFLLSLCGIIYFNSIVER